MMTTIFVSVSDSLPRTSYIKMVDIWLIFNLFIPFVEVLIHTYKVFIVSGSCPVVPMWQDTLRSDEEEVNSPGEVISIAGKGGVVECKANTRDIKTKKNQVEDPDDQRKGKYFSENAWIRKGKKLMLCNWTAEVLTPVVALSFIAIYWTIGLVKYWDPGM